jgi:two-component system NtrC family response regulator
LQILASVKKESPLTPVLVITAFGSIELAVKAMQEGAFTFLAKPFDREVLRLSCRKALEMRRLQEEKQQLSGEVNRLTGTEGMETANSAMRELLDTAMRAASSEASVLIAGESGTGKEVLARLIHQHSPRAQGPMVAVNCAAIPENLLESELFGHVRGAFTGAVRGRKGRFHSAAGGTLFLDEIGELRLDLQAKLLRAIQERVVTPVGADQPEEVDIRLIAASNRDLYAAIGQGTFREDLYYRLGVILLQLPPLRERREDIAPLVTHFLRKLDAPAGVEFSSGALARLRAHPWPGNIRELQNVVERAIILRRGPRIEADDLQLVSMPQPAAANGIPEIPDEGLSLEEMELGLIKKALAKADGNRSQAARLLKIPRHVLIYRLEKFKI